MSADSENPINNKAVTAEFNKKLNTNGGTMTGTLRMGGNDILNVKKIVFDSNNGEWLNMSGRTIADLGKPTAGHHAANKEYVDETIVPLINCINDLKTKIDNTVFLVTFNNADFENSDTEQFPTGISFVLNSSRILLTVTFDTGRMNFSIPDGADVVLRKVLVESEAFDLSLLDSYIKGIESFSQDYGEGWVVDGEKYMYMHEYSFGTAENAQSVLSELQESLNLTGFQLLVTNYKNITAQEV